MRMLTEKEKEDSESTAFPALTKKTRNTTPSPGNVYTVYELITKVVPLAEEATTIRTNEDNSTEIVELDSVPTESVPIGFYTYWKNDTISPNTNRTVKVRKSSTMNIKGQVTHIHTMENGETVYETYYKTTKSPDATTTDALDDISFVNVTSSDPEATLPAVPTPNPVTFRPVTVRDYLTTPIPPEASEISEASESGNNRYMDRHDDQQVDGVQDEATMTTIEPVIDVKMMTTEPAYPVMDVTMTTEEAELPAEDTSPEPLDPYQPSQKPLQNRNRKKPKNPKQPSNPNPNPNPNPRPQPPTQPQPMSPTMAPMQPMQPMGGGGGAGGSGGNYMDPNSGSMGLGGMEMGRNGMTMPGMPPMQFGNMNGMNGMQNQGSGGSGMSGGSSMARSPVAMAPMSAARSPIKGKSSSAEIEETTVVTTNDAEITTVETLDTTTDATTTDHGHETSDTTSEDTTSAEEMATTSDSTTSKSETKKPRKPKSTAAGVTTDADTLETATGLTGTEATNTSAESSSDVITSDPESSTDHTATTEDHEHEDHHEDHPEGSELSTKSSSSSAASGGVTTAKPKKKKKKGKKKKETTSRDNDNTTS